MEWRITISGDDLLVSTFALCLGEQIPTVWRKSLIVLGHDPDAVSQEVLDSFKMSMELIDVGEADGGKDS